MYEARSLFSHHGLGANKRASARAIGLKAAALHGGGSQPGKFHVVQGMTKSGILIATI